jgi:hypothetical protein
MINLSAYCLVRPLVVFIGDIDAGEAIYTVRATLLKYNIIALIQKHAKNLNRNEELGIAAVYMFSRH